MPVIREGMYEGVRCNVLCDKGETDFFLCSNGLKQECISILLLFSYLISVGGHSLQFHPDVSE